MAHRSSNRWLILALGTVVHIVAVGIPWTVMPVLFTSASEELHLSLGELGLLWSMMPIGTAIFALPGGLLGDRLGFARTIGVACFVVAAASVLRGLATNLATLSLFMFLSGASIALVFPTLQKTGGMFPRREQGLATGLLVSGFLVGGVLATALSATVLMPLLGSWRNVLFAYSGLAALAGAIWLLMVKGPAENPKGLATVPAPKVSVRECVRVVFRVKDTWLLALGNMAVVGSFIALTGYLPTYLEQATQSKTMADTMSSTLFGASIVGAILVPTLADRLRASRAVLVAASFVAFAGIMAMPFAGAPLFWVLVPLAGASIQGAGTLVVTRIVQMKEVGFAYAGTALGLVGGLCNFGGFVMPAVGGPLAEVNQSWPFILWALLVLLGAGCFALLKAGRREVVAGEVTR